MKKIAETRYNRIDENTRFRYDFVRVGGFEYTLTKVEKRIFVKPKEVWVEVEV